MPVEKIECDCLVAGAGVAGISAAVRAAREGAKVLLLEKNTAAGGTVISMMHSCLCGLYLNTERVPRETLNGGLAGEMCRILKRIDPDKTPQRMGRLFVLPVKVSSMRECFQNLLESEKGLKVMYETEITDVKTDDGRITAVTANAKGRICEIKPRVVVDASGEGAVISLSGAGYSLANAAERQMKGFAFEVKGIKKNNEVLQFKVPFILSKAVDSGALPFHAKFTTYMDDAGESGLLRISLPSDEKNDSSDNAQVEARKIHRYLSEKSEEFSGSSIGLMSERAVDREGIRLKGKYTLGYNDVLGEKKFLDGVVKNAWPIEIWDRKKGPVYKYSEPGAYYEIPVRCLKADDISNLYCAGRCISVSHEALGSTRVAGTCISIGEQAGNEAVKGLKNEFAEVK